MNVYSKRRKRRRRQNNIISAENMVHRHAFVNFAIPYNECIGEKMSSDSERDKSHRHLWQNMKELLLIGENLLMPSELFKED